MRLLDLFGRKNKCEDCGTTFESWEELVDHERVEHKRKVLKCSKCRREFLKESERFKHMKEAHKR